MTSILCYLLVLGAGELDHSVFIAGAADFSCILHRLYRSVGIMAIFFCSLAVSYCTFSGLPTSLTVCKLCLLTLCKLTAL